MSTEEQEQPCHAEAAEENPDQEDPQAPPDIQPPVEEVVLAAPPPRFVTVLHDRLLPPPKGTSLKLKPWMRQRRQNNV